MPHEFDTRSFAAVVEQLRAILRSARDHERQLTQLLNTIEAIDHRVAVTSSDALPSTEVLKDTLTPTADLYQGRDLLSLLRDLCSEARHQRGLAETLVSSLLGNDERLSDRKRVLVVDDSQDSRELAAVVLEALGLNVITATNGLEAVLFAHYGQPAVILMDITMPVLDGFEAARLLKTSPATRHSHVVAYTAQPEYCEGPLRRFFVDVVAKPATPELIVRKIQRVLDDTPPVADSD